MYAKTTIRSEFSESKLVVRVRVQSAHNYWNQKILSDSDDQSWTLYKLKTLKSFKGTPPHYLMFFTWRDSGGFYMDRFCHTHKPCGDYLLFLNPISSDSTLPKTSRGAYFVNYSCGQSKKWEAVTKDDVKELETIKAQH